MHVGQLNMFLQAIRRHQWDDGLLPSTAAIFREDYPRPPELLPRFLAEHVMAQVEDPANLGRWKDSNWRLITVILIRCGLRVSSAVSLAFDCVVADAAGAPYLRYYNTKMKREALVPVDDELCQMIRDHQEQVLSHWPGRTVPVLFPRTKANTDGSRPVSPSARRCSWVKPTPRFRLGEDMATGIRGVQVSLITTSGDRWARQSTVRRSR